MPKIFQGRFSGKGKPVSGALSSLLQMQQEGQVTVTTKTEGDTTEVTVTPRKIGREMPQFIVEGENKQLISGEDSGCGRFFRRESGK